MQDPINLIDPTGLSQQKDGPLGGMYGNYRSPYRKILDIAETNGAIFEGYNDASDAFRHAYTSREIADQIGPATSFFLGAGHEVQNLLEGYPVNESIMDMKNNFEGISSSFNNRLINNDNLQTSCPKR